MRTSILRKTSSLAAIALVTMVVGGCGSVSKPASTASPSQAIPTATAVVTTQPTVKAKAVTAASRVKVPVKAKALKPVITITKKIV